MKSEDMKPCSACLKAYHELSKTMHDDEAKAPANLYAGRVLEALGWLRNLPTEAPQPSSTFAAWLKEVERKIEQELGRAGGPAADRHPMEQSQDIGFGLGIGAALSILRNTLPPKQSAVEKVLALERDICVTIQGEWLVTDGGEQKHYGPTPEAAAQAALDTLNACPTCNAGGQPVYMYVVLKRFGFKPEDGKGKIFTAEAVTWLKSVLNSDYKGERPPEPAKENLMQDCPDCRDASDTIEEETGQ